MIKYLKNLTTSPKTSKTYLGQKLHGGEGKSVVIGADRTEREQEALRDSGDTDTSYPNCQHGSVQGFKAADVRYYYASGNQIDPQVVANEAEKIGLIGGVGVYKTFTHIDWRDRKPDGTVSHW